MTEEGTCHSCGAVEELYRVHRVYVTPEDWDTEAKVEPQTEVELWCYTCRVHYPHQEAEG